MTGFGVQGHIYIHTITRQHSLINEKLLNKYNMVLVGKIYYTDFECIMRVDTDPGSCCDLSVNGQKWSECGLTRSRSIRCAVGKDQSPVCLSSLLFLF